MKIIKYLTYFLKAIGYLIKKNIYILTMMCVVYINRPETIEDLFLSLFILLIFIADRISNKLDLILNKANE